MLAWTKKNFFGNVWTKTSQVELLDPAILGKRNVLNACLKAKVNKVVVVSSVIVVILNPKWPKDKEMDESWWTDAEFAKSLEVSHYYIQMGRFAYILFLTDQMR